MMWNVALLTLQLASQTPSAASSPQSCPLKAIESDFLAKFLSGDDQSSLISRRNQWCEDIRNKRLTFSTADIALGLLTLRLAACRGSDINPSYRSMVEGMWAGAQTVLSVGKYCRDTLTLVQREIDFKRLMIRHVWLHNERFCALSSYFVDPGGWRAVFRSDMPSQIRLREQADSLCREVRDQKLSIDEAWYRLELEMAKAKDHLVGEAAREFGSLLKSAIETARELLH